MKLKLLFVSLCMLLLAACAPAPTQPALGTESNPIKMAMIPFANAEQIIKDMTPFVELVAKESGYKIKFDVTTSNAPAIEGLCSSKLDVVWFGPLGYVIAADKCGAQVMLVTEQKGSSKYRGAFFVQKNSPYQKLEDLKGKRVAFTEPTSTSGYLYPNGLLKSKGLDPKTFFGEAIFSGGHDAAVIALYKGQVDVAAAFENTPETRVQKTLPDVLDKVRPLEYTDWIPNDNVAAGKHVPPEVVEKLKAALMKVTSTPAGSAAMAKAITSDKLVPIDDKAYDPIRVAAKSLGLDLEKAIQPAPTPTKAP
jgi:phosphonate transport system substrate-binding protein